MKKEEDAVRKIALYRAKGATACNSRWLRCAAENGLKDEVLEAINAGADVHAMCDYAIRKAASAGYEEICRILLDAGADAGALNKEAIRFAKANKHFDVAKLLEASLS